MYMKLGYIIMNQKVRLRAQFRTHPQKLRNVYVNHELVSNANNNREHVRWGSHSFHSNRRNCEPCELLLCAAKKPEIRFKHSGKVRKGVILQQDNARPHSAKRTANTINELGMELPQPPLRSPNLAPSDFHTLGALMEKDSLLMQKS
uniref:Histone-lysine N-methyltransferase SETMAR n=1 Tax=Rhipicephalus zambeziensis TaxID=60191 RepID=A0A224YPS6_9ACAR